MENDFRAISPDEIFRFSCTKAVACFNECCRDLNQFLTPYDILRLKTGLGLASTEFLERYTTRHMGPETGLPIISLKPKSTSGLACPFVEPSGCCVYAHRPSSCRIYPVARAISRSRQTGLIEEHFALIKEPHCLGHRQNKTQSVRTWVADQELDIYNEFNDMLMDIIALKNQQGPEPLDMKAQIQFHTALYDLDRFRAQLFEKGIGEDRNLDADLLKRARKDDLALLWIGHAWVRKTLFMVE